jgi:plasmid replication initiation protein
MDNLADTMTVTQSNKLVEAAHSLTLGEKRLVIAAAATFDPRLPPPRGGRIVTLHVEQFADVFGLPTKQAYETLADAAKRLYNRSIRRIEEKRGRKIITDMRWVGFAQYNEGEGTVSLGFTEHVMGYLTLLHTEFTSYRLKHVGQLGSFYAVRIYELCVQFRKAGERKITLERLRDTLDLGEKYANVKELRRRVLAPAITEINKHTDLRVVMTPERKGRKVVAFHFDITQDDQIPLDLPFPKDSAADLAPAPPAEPLAVLEESATDSEQEYYGLEQQWRCDEAKIAELFAQKAALLRQHKAAAA